MTLNIGLIDYLNTMPFHYDLAERLQDVDVHFERGVPSMMNRMLKSGEIDVTKLVSGTYIVSITHKNGSVHQQKIVVFK